MFGWRIKNAANEVAAAGQAGEIAAYNANQLVLAAQKLFNDIKKQGFLEGEIDLTDNPLLARLGIPGIIKVKIRLP